MKTCAALMLLLAFGCGDEGPGPGSSEDGTDAAADAAVQDGPRDAALDAECPTACADGSVCCDRICCAAGLVCCPPMGGPDTPFCGDPATCP